MFHELAANAIKFGAMTTATGRIEVTWDISTSPRRLTLAWLESTPHQSGFPPTRGGFGMEAIEGMLPYQLKAESRLELLSEGLRCTIALPLSNVSD